MVKNPPAMQIEPRFDSWVGKIHWRRDRLPTPVFLAFSCGSTSKESTCNAGDPGSIPGLGRSPGEGKGYPLQYSGLENSIDCIVHGVTKSWTRLSDFHFHFSIQLKKKKKEVHIAVQPLPFQIFLILRNWHSTPTINTRSPSSPPPAPGNHHRTFSMNLMALGPQPSGITHCELFF